jgi:hypothetical protein
MQLPPAGSEDLETEPAVDESEQKLEWSDAGSAKISLGSGTAAKLYNVDCVIKEVRCDILERRATKVKAVRTFVVKQSCLKKWAKTKEGAVCEGESGNIYSDLIVKGKADEATARTVAAAMSGASGSDNNYRMLKRNSEAKTVQFSIPPTGANRVWYDTACVAGKNAGCKSPIDYYSSKLADEEFYYNRCLNAWLVSKDSAECEKKCETGTTLNQETGACA